MSKVSEVGYRRPPKHSRYKPGQSGNPKGRPKGRPNLARLIEKTFAERLTIKTADGPRQVTGAELVLLRLREKAAKGDLKAIDLSLKHLAAIYLDQDESDPESTAEDAEILRGFEAILNRQRRLKGKGDE